MAEKNCVLGLILSFSPYLRSAKPRFPFQTCFKIQCTLLRKFYFRMFNTLSSNGPLPPRLPSSRPDKVLLCDLRLPQTQATADQQQHGHQPVSRGKHACKIGSCNRAFIYELYLRSLDVLKLSTRKIQLDIQTCS